MYNKIKKFLESMGFDFLCCESMYLFCDRTLNRGFKMGYIYIEVEEDVNIYDMALYPKSSLITKIANKESELMFAEFGYFINYLEYNGYIMKKEVEI